MILKQKRSLLRAALVLAGLVAVFTIVGFLVLPWVARSQIEQRVTKLLGRQVTVEKVRLNPYALTVTLENFAIREADGVAPFLGWRRLYVNFDALSSLQGEWVIGDVELDGFETRARLNPDQSFNFSDILAKLAPPADAPPPAATAPGRPVRVARLQVSDARIDLADMSRRQPFTTVFGPLTFSLTEFRTAGGRGAPYQFEAASEAGERLVWSGSLAAEPLQSRGELRIEDLVLAKYAPYYADAIQADLAGGTLSIRGQYELSLAENQRTMKFSDGTVQVRGVRVLERGAQEPALELPVVDVTGIEADAVALKAVIGAIQIAGGNVRAQREQTGVINLLAMLQPPAGTLAVTTAPAAAPVSSPAPAVTTPAPLPDVTLREFAVQNFRVDVTDLSAPRPVRLTLDEVQLKLQDVTLAEGAKIPLQLAFNWAPQGKVRLEGNVGMTPAFADLKIEVAQLGILPVSPYLEEFVNARLTDGIVSATLTTQVAFPPGQPTAATVTGDLAMEKFGLLDGAHNEELVGFGRLALQGLRATAGAAMAVEINGIDLVGPYARVAVNPDKSLNFATLAKVAPPAPDAPEASPAVIALPETAPAGVKPATGDAARSPAAATPVITIGTLSISDGDFRFTDRSVEPHVAMAMNQFAATLKGLSSANPAKAELDVKAMVDGAGPVAIVGRLDPFGAQRSVDLKVDFKNVDLVPLSPYSGRYAGYELARGKLLLDVKLLLEGSRLDTTNVITLNQLTFGNVVKSAEATTLPVRLGVALLKDMDGRIVIDVPVQGKLDDPSFQVGKVVVRVIVNLLTKAAVSPFSLLGAAFGGGGDELAFQEFGPGRAEIEATEKAKLETMTKALTNRPALSLGIEGSYDAAADAYILKRTKLADRVRRAVWETRRQSDPNIAPPEKLEIGDEDYAAALKRMYDEQFPPGTEFGAPVPPPPVLSTPPPAPQGFFRRITRAVTGEAKREAAALAAENARRAAEHEQAVAAAIATGLPLEQMTGRLAETVTVDENDLRMLAQQRAQQVRDYFVNVGKVAPDRLFLAKDSPDATSEVAVARTGKGPRVFLQLQ